MERGDSMSLLSNPINNSVQNSGNLSNTGTAGTSNSQTFTNSGNQLGFSEGQLVKGIVTDIHDSRITIQMEDGTAFTGQLADASKYSIGQKAAFQVLNTSAKTILMKSLSEAYILNSDDTIFKALDAANLPKNIKNIDVVRALLNTQQSISKESILSSLRFCSRFPESSADAVLTMKYLSLPMTKESVAVFEQYQNQNHQLMTKMNVLTESVNQILDFAGKQSPSTAIHMGMQFLDLALENSDFLNLPLDSDSIQSNETFAASSGQILVSENYPDGTPLPKDTLFINGELVSAKLVEEEIVFIEDSDVSDELRRLVQETPKESITLLSKESTGITELSSNGVVKEQIGTLLPTQTLTEFQTLIKELPLPEQLMQEIQNGTATSKEVLTKLQTILPTLPPEEAGKLLSSIGFKALLKEQLLSGWTISPKAFKNPENIEKLYEKLDRQLETITKFSENVNSQKSFSDMGTTSSNMQQNLQFIKTLNENLNYMQLPLKLSEENAHGDLYVMTKKDSLKKHPDKLRVLLHLELEHLGTLDVHIEKENTNVTTKFFVQDKKTLRLFEKNIELLSDALNEQGFLLTTETHLHEKKMDIVKDFIAQDVPIGDMKRYNFDLRA